jgi:hypothetical protein
LTPEQLARIEQNKQEARARLERNRLIRLEQQNQQNLQNPVPPQNQPTHQHHQDPQSNQNQKQFTKNNREHYKQASLEEKQIVARVNYKTHQKIGTPSGS